MKNISTYILIGLMGSGLSALAALTAEQAAKLPPASTQKDITYAKDIKPILEASCFNCHGEKNPKAGINLTSVENVLKGGKDGKIVEVGSGEKSLIVEATSQLNPRTSMPPKPRAPRGGMAAATNAPAGGAPATPPPAPAKPLTPEQVGLVRAWIDQGAK
jgi:mono/diheme cytochrome c family protein